MSMEEALRENTIAVLAHTDLLKRMIDSKAGGATAEGDKPARVRRTKAQIEADEAAERAGKEPAKEAVKEEERPRRERASRDEPAKETDEVADFRALLGKFLDFGKEGNEADEKERNYRLDFIEDVNKHFEVSAARDIPAKNFKKVLRWLKLVEDNKEVDFDND